VECGRLSTSPFASPIRPSRASGTFQPSPMVDRRSRRRLCPRPRWRRWQSPGRTAQSLTRESQADHGCERKPDQATPAEMATSATTGHKCGFNPANDQAADRAHHRGHASLQLLFGHSRHHGGGRSGLRPATATRSLWREELTRFWPSRAVGVGAWPPGADRMGGSREGPCWAQMTCMCRHHVIVAAQPIAPVTRRCAAATRLLAANSWLFIGPKQP
jgi:hypothetical protein